MEPGAAAGAVRAVAAAGLIAAAAVLGEAALERFGGRDIPAADRAALGAGLSLGALSFVVFLSGLLGWLSPALLLILYLLFLAAGLAIFVGRCLLAARHGRNEPASTGPRSYWLQALLAVAATTLLLACWCCLSPMVDYDGLAYHVAAPKRWLEIGAIGPTPTRLHAEWPMGFEMLYLLLLPVSGPDGCKILVGLTAGLTAVAAWRLGARIASPAAGAAAAAITVIAAGVDKIDTTSIEFPLVLFATLSALAVSHWSRAAGPSARRWLVIAALLAGMGCGIKLNGLLCAAVLTAAVTALSLRRAESRRARLKSIALFIAVAAAAACPWYLRTWQDTGSPITPFGWPLLRAPGWSGETVHTLSLYFRTFNLAGPTPSARIKSWLWHLVRMLIVSGVAAALPAPRPLRLAMSLAGLFAALQVAGSDQPRFLLPALPFAALYIGWWLTQAATKWPIVGWAAAAASGAWAIPPSARSARDCMPLVLGTAPRLPYLRRSVSVLPACEWANSHLPADARVLFGLDTRTLFLEREPYWSNSLTQRLLPFDRGMGPLLDALDRQKIRYLIYNRSLLNVETVQFEMRWFGRDREAACLEALAARSRRLWSNENVLVCELPVRQEIHSTPGDHQRHRPIR